MGEGQEDQNQIKNKILGSDFYRGSKNSQTLKEKEKRKIKKGGVSFNQPILVQFCLYSLHLRSTVRRNHIAEIKNLGFRIIRASFIHEHIINIIMRVTMRFMLTRAYIHERDFPAGPSSLVYDWKEMERKWKKKSHMYTEKRTKNNKIPHRRHQYRGQYRERI